MTSVVEPEERLPLVESNHNLGPRRRSGEATESTRKTLHRASASTSCLHDSSDSSRQCLSDDSIYPAPVCSISEKLNELSTTQTVVANGASFEMLAAPTGIESNLVTSVHYPHTLDPIIEQRSFSSLRHSPQLSMKQKRSIVSRLSLRRSANVLRQLADARRKASFSLTDLTLFKNLSQFIDTPSSSQTSLHPAPQVQPAVPPRAVLQRPRTPLGLPTFNTREAHSYRLPRPQSLPRLPRPHQFHNHSPRAIRKMFRERLAAHTALSEWRYQTQNLPRGAVMRGRDGTLVYGSWRPTQSGHTGHVSPTNRRGRNAGASKAGRARAGGNSMAAASELLRQYGLSSNSAMRHSTTLPPVPAAPADIELSNMRSVAYSNLLAPVPLRPGAARVVPRAMPLSLPSQTSSGQSGRQRMPVLSFCCCWSLGGEGLGSESV